MFMTRLFALFLLVPACALAQAEPDGAFRRAAVGLASYQFSDPRIVVAHFDPHEPLLGARVPVLILQPIVENAVKYGVAKSKKPVTIRITAYEEAGRLHIKVKDDGEAINPEEADAGTGVGLKNVCDRLTARYGARAGCIHGADPDGGFTVHIYLPVIRNG